MRRFRCEVALLLLSLVLVPLQVRGRRGSDPLLQRFWSTAAAPLRSGGGRLWSWFHRWRAAEGELEALGRRNRELRRLTLAQRIRIAQLEDRVREEGRRRELAAAVQPEGWTLVFAHALVTRDPFLQPSLELDRGREAGMVGGEPVVSAQGVLGLIRPGCGPRRARVRTILDPGVRIAVRLEGTDLLAMAEGRRGEVAVLWCPRGSPVVPGTTWVSSGLDRQAPPGLPVAVTESVLPRSDGFLEIHARPAADFSRLDTVAVLVPK